MEKIYRYSIGVWTTGQAFDGRCFLRVIAQVASGLDAAHQLTDDEGKSLSLVHRDVTGHNIMLSFDGHTKLADFGIAKADRG